MDVIFDAAGHRIEQAERGGRLKVRLGRTQRLWRIIGWTPRDGLIEQRVPIERDGPHRVVTLEQPGDFRLEDPAARAGAHDRFFCWQGTEVSMAGREAIERKWREPVDFGELRSAVAQASAPSLQQREDGGAALRAAWRAALQIMRYVEPPSQRRAAHGYFNDHLARVIDAHALPRLVGSNAVHRWARDARLRALQKLSYFADDYESTHELLFAQLIARTQSEASLWVDGRPLIYEGDIAELVSWLIHDARDA